MKVYYETPDYNMELLNAATLQFFQKVKYRLMWELRYLENEINEEGGIFIIKKDAKIAALEFSEELMEKIRDVLYNIKWDQW